MTFLPVIIPHQKLTFPCHRLQSKCPRRNALITSLVVMAVVLPMEEEVSVDTVAASVDLVVLRASVDSTSGRHTEDFSASKPRKVFNCG